MKKTTKSAGPDDRKLQSALQKLGVQPLGGIEEVNMFKEDGKVIHFAAPRGKSIDNMYASSSWLITSRSLVQAAVNSNTFAIHGRSVEKELTELGK